MADQSAKFDIRSAQRIAKATQWVEGQPRNTLSQRRDAPPDRSPFWARITDAFRRVPSIGGTEPDTLESITWPPSIGYPVYYSWAAITVDGNAAQYASTAPADPPVTGTGNAFQVNASPQSYVPPGTIVQLNYAGCNAQGESFYFFSWEGAAQNAGLIPHDHRSGDPNYGGFAFSVYAPANLAQQPWAI